MKNMGWLFLVASLAVAAYGWKKWGDYIDGADRKFRDEEGDWYGY